MRFYNYFICILVLCVAACSTRNNVSTDSIEPSLESISDTISKKTESIFGTTIHLDERMAIRELSEAGIMQVDTIMEKNGEFENAIIEFAGVKFGMNKGFVFLTSRQDKQAIDSLVDCISKYYGEPFIEDYDKPELSWYHWNLPAFDTIGQVHPIIRIRPIRTRDGGLMMSWGIYKYHTKVTKHKNVNKKEGHI